MHKSRVGQEGPLARGMMVERLARSWAAVLTHERQAAATSPACTALTVVLSVPYNTWLGEFVG